MHETVLPEIGVGAFVGNLKIKPFSKACVMRSAWVSVGVKINTPSRLHTQTYY